MAERKEPQTIAAIESIRMLAGEAMGLVGRVGKPPFASPPHGADASFDWAVSQGDGQASRGAEDVAVRALFFKRMEMRFAALPMMPRLRAQGLEGPEAERDRLRLAMGYSGHPEFGEGEELLAAIEARRIVAERGFPKYWTTEQDESVRVGMSAILDRAIAETINAEPKDKKEAFKKAGETLGSLGGNCDLLSMYCEQENARAGAAPERLAEIAARQAEIVACAKDMARMPSLDRSVRNIVLAGVVGVAWAAAMPVVGHAAMPYLQELAHALPYAKGIVSSVGEMKFGYGLATSCAALAASAGSFLGVGYKANSRLDALGEAQAVKSGMGPETARQACARAVDERLCRSFFNLSEEILSSSQRAAFVEALGHVRGELVGPTLGGHQFDNARMKQSRENLPKIPLNEMALIGQISEPAIAACFLLDAKSTTDRLDLMMLQKRLDYLGCSQRPLDTSAKVLGKAREQLILAGRQDTWMMLPDDKFRELLAERMAPLTPMGQRFSTMCPKAQQAEFVASLLEKPLDPANPDLDMAKRLGATLKINCARLERKNFIERKISGFAEKATRSLIQDPMRALRSLADWAMSSKEKQSFDFESQTRALARASGGLKVLATGNADKKAQSRFEQSQQDLARVRGIIVEASSMPSAESALGSVMAKLRSRKAASAPPPELATRGSHP